MKAVMEKGGIGIAIAKTLDSREAIERWKADPLTYLKSAGFPLSHLDSDGLRIFRNYLASTPVRVLAGPRCIGCRIVVGGTMVRLTAALEAFIAGLVIDTDGVDAAVAPEEVVAAAGAERVAIAAETGLSAAKAGMVVVNVLRRFVAWARANPVKAAGFIAAPVYAVEELVSEISDAICKASGACTS